MIVKSADVRTTSQSAMRGGNGTIAMTHFLEKEASENAGRLFFIATLPSVASIGRHTHESECEVHYIIEGTAHVMDNDVPGVLEAGDCMVCKNGDSHSIENRGGRDLKALLLILYPNSSK